MSAAQLVDLAAKVVIAVVLVIALFNGWG